MIIYVDAEKGKDHYDGSSPKTAVRTLKRAMKLWDGQLRIKRIERWNEQN